MFLAVKATIIEVKNMVTSLSIVLLIVLMFTPSSQCCKGKYGSLRLKYISNPLLLREGKNVDVNIEADIKRDLPGALKADVRLEKEFGFVWIPIPCFNNMGSCKYDVTCDMFHKIQNDGHNKIDCPLKRGVISKKFSYTFPKIPKLVSDVGAGRYKLKIAVKNMAGETLACGETMLDVKT